MSFALCTELPERCDAQSRDRAVQNGAEGATVGRSDDDAASDVTRSSGAPRPANAPPGTVSQSGSVTPSPGLRLSSPPLPQQVPAAADVGDTWDTWASGQLAAAGQTTALPTGPLPTPPGDSPQVAARPGTPAAMPGAAANLASAGVPPGVAATNGAPASPALTVADGHTLVETALLNALLARVAALEQAVAPGEPAAGPENGAGSPAP